MGRLEGKTAFITGGSRGIGRAMAGAFVREGATVGLCARDGDAAKKAAAELKADGREGIGYALDVSDREQVERVFEDFLKQSGGRLDVLVNNAGLTRDSLLLRMTQEQWDETMRINLNGTFHCTKAVLRTMIKQEKGRIINLTSVVAQIGNPGQANYAAAKGGIIAFTKSLAKELASRNITVNAISPGFIKTYLTNSMPEKAKAFIMERIPLGRFGDPEDLAGAAVFLASDEATYITGQVLGVDGGLAM